MTYVEEGEEPPFISIDERQDLLTALSEMSFCSHDAMGGMNPLTWLEMGAYVKATRMSWTPADYRLVAIMSRAYITGRTEGEDLFSIAPSDREVYQ